MTTSNKVQVVFMADAISPVFYGVFDSYLSVVKHFTKGDGTEVLSPKEGLGMFTHEGVKYTVQEQEVNHPCLG